MFDGTQKLSQDRVIPPTVDFLGRVGSDVGYIPRVGGCDVVKAIVAEVPDVLGTRGSKRQGHLTE
jgi:hypothetical protein